VATSSFPARGRAADFGNPREGLLLLLQLGKGNRGRAVGRQGHPSGPGHRGHLPGARLGDVGHQVVIFDRLGGPEAALAMVRRRSGGWRILARSRVSAPLARTAGMRHERQDGSGYHRGAFGAQVPAGARVLAAADAFQAMTQPRPHRPGLAPEAAAAALAEEARGAAWTRVRPGGGRGRRAAPPRVRTAWPAGLSDREVEVLRLVARGLSNRAIAERLYVSPRTAEHHVQHIYTKIGASTRAAAAMFAMEHSLLRD
jgi:DNA-binding CsgD family transcriptional regulator